MCHVELHCVQSVRAAAINGTQIMERPETGTRGHSERMWEEGEES